MRNWTFWAVSFANPKPFFLVGNLQTQILRYSGDFFGMLNVAVMCKILAIEQRVVFSDFKAQVQLVLTNL